MESEAVPPSSQGSQPVPRTDLAPAVTTSQPQPSAITKVPIRFSKPRDSREKSKYDGLKFSFAVGPRPQIKRTKAPKVRTGCRTCKRRHIKCDETRPSCLRCIKWQGFCGGYDSAEQPAGDSQKDSGSSSSSSPQEDLKVLVDPPTSPFQSQSEHDYYGTWVTLSSSMGGDFLADLYTTLITQVGFQNDTVRHATLAVGSLKFALQGASDHKSIMKCRDTQHYKDALVHYCRALRMVQSAAVDPQNVRVVLLCCILFTCFEVLDRNRAAVHKHVHHGIAVVDHHLRGSQARTSLGNCTKSPMPYTIDDPLIQIFQRFEMLSWAQLALVPKVPLSKLPGGKQIHVIGSEAKRVPEVFYDLKEAGQWLDLLYKRLINFFRAVIHERDKLIAKGLNAPEPAKNPLWLENRIPHLKSMDQWDAAFQPVRAEAAENAKRDKAMFACSIRLRLQWITLMLSVQTHQYLDYTALVEAAPLFEEAIELDEELERLGIDDKDQPVFSLDNGSIFILYIIATKARSAALRQRALSRLKASTRIDGLWDTGAAVAVCDWMKGLEKEYATQIDDPEELWNRIRFRHIFFDAREPKATAQAYRLDPQTGEWQMKEEILTWDT